MESSVTEKIKDKIIFDIIDRIVSKIRTHLEFSREANKILGSMQKAFPSLLEIGFACESRQVIEIIFSISDENMVQEQLKKLEEDHQNISSAKILYYDDIDILEFELKINLTHPLKDASKITQKMIDSYDDWIMRNKKTY